MRAHRFFVAGYLCALGALATCASAAESILDTPSSTTGTWFTNSHANANGSSYRWASGANPATATITWKPSLAAGTYGVSVWYPPDTNATSAAQYTVYYSGGSTTFTIDQTVKPGRWVGLGAFNFPAGPSESAKVVITNQGNTSKFVLADAVRFRTPLYMTFAVSPAGAGTTNPAAGPLPFPCDGSVSISATANPGYVFSHWEVSTGCDADVPAYSSTTVTMDVNPMGMTKTVTAVFVPTQPVSLTMAVSGPGTCTPTVGGPYQKAQTQAVSISAAPTLGNGNVFAHWKVSDGSPVVNPRSPNTTVIMDVPKTVTAEFVPSPQLRFFCADVFHYGLQNADQIDAMIENAVKGHYNAILAEVVAYHDCGAGPGESCTDPNRTYGSHGAYWRSSIVPPCKYVTDTFDPLQYMIQQAHLHGIELHAWLVAFRVNVSSLGSPPISGWPPQGNTILQAHPEYMMTPKNYMGSGPKTVGGDYVLDPGCPGAQEYLISIVRELVTNYDIDGINWDYIRYTQNDGGYPADSTYQNSGLKRFQRIYGRSDVPMPTNDAQWDDFRRRSITELVRRAQMEIESLRPDRPLRHTGDLVCWGNAPSDFVYSSAYGLYSNWEEWMRLGYLDGGCPMAYYREFLWDQKAWYRNWIKACLDWRYQRHMYITQANYVNHMPDSLDQMRYALHTDEEPARSVDGIGNYSYWSTETTLVISPDHPLGSEYHNATWYTNLANVPSLFVDDANPQVPLTVPPMPWRDPATATEGRLWGRVTKAGVPIDNAFVTVAGQPMVQTDGNGYYVATMIPPSDPGTSYDVTAVSGNDVAIHRVQIVPGRAVREDISLDRSTINGWRSVRSHAGTDLSVTLDETAGGTGPAPIIEPRQGGIRRIEVDFAAHVTLVDPLAVQVTGYTTTNGVLGSAVSYTPAAVTEVDSDTLAIEFADGQLPDQTCYVIQVGRNAVSPAMTAAADCAVRTLAGETTGNGSVNLGDALYVRTKVGDPVAAATAIFDVDVSGTIDSADVVAAREQVTLPAHQALYP